MSIVIKVGLSPMDKLKLRIKELEKQINGAECGHGSLWEQGYNEGSEHASKHYKKRIQEIIDIIEDEDHSYLELGKRDLTPILAPVFKGLILKKIYAKNKEA
jgi:hypothetical protein